MIRIFDIFLDSLITNHQNSCMSRMRVILAQGQHQSQSMEFVMLCVTPATSYPSSLPRWMFCQFVPAQLCL